MASHQAGQADESSIGQLVSELSEQTSRLVRDEVALAKVELKDSARHAGLGAGLFTAAGLLGLYAVGVFVATAIIALDLAWPLWLSALVVGAVLAVAAGIAAVAGRKQVSEVSPVVDRTAETAKDDIREVKEAARHAR
jgi:hypothetical protein